MKYLLLTVALSALFVSCKTASNQIQPLEQKSIRELVSNPKTVLVDVRMAAEFEEETAKGAINIPVEDLDKNLSIFQNAENVVVFCNRGIKADKAMEILKKNGIKNAHDGTSLKQIKALQTEQNK